MMGSFDVGLMLLGLFSFMAQVVLVLIALGCGIRSLVLLARSPDEATRGRRWALIALGLGMAVESWTFLFFKPWRILGPSPLHWLPLPAFVVGGCALALWGTLGSRRWSSTGRLMIVIAVATIAIGSVLNIQRWERRMGLLHQAGLYDQESRRFLEASETQRRCLEHRKRGEPCDRCKSDQSNEYYAVEFLKYAKLRAATAESYRRAADHGGEPSFVLSVD
jgi:hypothetical protein